MSRYFSSRSLLLPLALTLAFVCCGCLRKAAPPEAPSSLAQTEASLQQESAYEEPVVQRDEAKAVIEDRIKEAAREGPGALNAIGSPKAPVTVAMFQDLKCGMCKRAYNTLFKALKKDYIETGKVRWVFIENPLLYRTAEAVIGKAAKCAGEQGRYLMYLDYLYENMADISVYKLNEYAKLLKLDSAKFNVCLSSPRLDRSMEQDHETGLQLAVEGTPTFFLNGKEITGAAPVELFKEELDQELALANQ